MPVTIELLTAFFGWCVVVNSVVLLITTVSLYLGQNWIPKLHAGLFSLPEATVKASHFKFLANYKLITLTFSIVPYIALKIINA